MSPLKTLIGAMTSLGQSTDCLSLGGGAQLLILPHGGRVLGLFTGAESPNFFWTNPHPDFFPHCWPNVGGDRTWLSPELEFFISDLTNPLKNWRVPPEIDPGNYTLDLINGSPQLSMTSTFRLHHTRAKIRARITKSFTPSPNPVPNTRSLAYAGYTTHQSIELLEAPEKSAVALSLWTLLQLPHTGLALIGTKSTCHATRMFGKVADSDLNSSKSCAAFHAHSQSISKIGFPVRRLTGRIGYLCKSPDSTWTLVLRDFPVDSSKTYLDKPIIDLQADPCCVEICNYHTPTLAYTELEHHTPAIGFAAGELSYADSHHTWAYRGGAQQIAQIAAQLLGAHARTAAEKFSRSATPSPPPTESRESTASA
jgi:hypothetical protein